MNEKGTVKAYLESKGFGFITVNGEKDVFFHIKHRFGEKTVRIPKPGDCVVFTKKTGPKGLIAEPWGFEEDEVETLDEKTVLAESGENPTPKREFRRPDKQPVRYKRQLSKRPQSREW